MKAPARVSDLFGNSYYFLAIILISDWCFIQTESEVVDCLMRDSARQNFDGDVGRAVVFEVAKGDYQCFI